MVSRLKRLSAGSLPTWLKEHEDTRVSDLFCAGKMPVSGADMEKTAGIPSDVPWTNHFARLTISLTRYMRVITQIRNVMARMFLFWEEMTCLNFDPMISWSEKSRAG